MTYTAPPIETSAFIAMGVSALVCIIVPLILLLVWKKKTKASMSYFLIGIASFIIFALILEPILHNIVLGSGPVGTAIKGNIFLYALYGGLAAGIFEETGRYLSMNFLLRKNVSRENSIMYGIGHGGTEAVVIGTLTQFSNFITAFAINFSGINELLKAVPEELRDTTYNQLRALWETPSYMFYIGCYERMLAICIHLCCSYIVYRAIADRKISRFFLAILIHAFIDGSIVAVNSFAGAWVTEGVLTVMVIVLIVFTVRNYRRHPEEKAPEAAPAAPSIGLAEAAAINAAAINVTEINAAEIKAEADSETPGQDV